MPEIGYGVVGPHDPIPWIEMGSDRVLIQPDEVEDILGLSHGEIHHYIANDRWIVKYKESEEPDSAYGFFNISSTQISTDEADIVVAEDNLYRVLIDTLGWCGSLSTDMIDDIEVQEPTGRVESIPNGSCTI